MRGDRSGAITLEEMRRDSDWQEAFAYAGHRAKFDDDFPDAGFGTCGSPDLRRHPSDEATSLVPFSMGDVKQVVTCSEGENDESPWLCVGELSDGRWFFLEASCDYTGWDCRAGGTCHVAGSFDDLVQNCVEEEQREQLGFWTRDKLAELGIDPQGWAAAFVGAHGGDGHETLKNQALFASWFGAAMNNAAAEATAIAVASLTDANAGRRTEQGLVLPTGDEVTATRAEVRRANGEA